jgi:hypothetical protein
MFLVVAAFNPERTLLNPSVKLGSDVSLLHSPGVLSKKSFDSVYNSMSNV